MNSARGIVTASMIYVVVLFVLARGVLTTAKAAIQRASGSA